MSSNGGEGDLIPDLNNNTAGPRMMKSGGDELVLRKSRHLEEASATAATSSGSASSGPKISLDLNDDDDDYEVEDLAKMISCFALLMPNRITGGSSANGSNAATPSGSTTTANRNSGSGSSLSARKDIMLTAAAAASALGMGQVKRQASMFNRLKNNG